MTPFTARVRYYGPEGDLLVIAITSGNPVPIATCVRADGELVAVEVTDLRALRRATNWPGGQDWVASEVTA